MSEADDLVRALADLREARATGVKRVRSKQNGVEKETEFKTDAELAAAIADCERRLAALQRAPVAVTYVTSSKGL